MTTSTNVSLDISTSSSDALRINGKHVETKKEPAASETKGNFFKNIRSQFSFSSLRKKNQKKSQANLQLDKTLEEKRSKSDEEEKKLTRSKSFSEKSPVSITSLQPRMTSTPLSEEERKTTPRREQQGFRTAASKSQQHRWSLAESHIQQHHLQQHHLQQQQLQQHVLQQQQMNHQQMNQQQMNLEHTNQQQLTLQPLNQHQLQNPYMQQQQYRHHLAEHHHLYHSVPKYQVPHNNTISYHTKMYPPGSQHGQKHQQPRHQPPQQLSLVGHQPSNAGHPQSGPGLSQPYFTYGPPSSQSVCQRSSPAETCPAIHGEIS